MSMNVYKGVSYCCKGLYRVNVRKNISRYLIIFKKFGLHINIVSSIVEMKMKKDAYLFLIIISGGQIKCKMCCLGHKTRTTFIIYNRTRIRFGVVTVKDLYLMRLEFGSA